MDNLGMCIKKCACGQYCHITWGCYNLKLKRDQYKISRRCNDCRNKRKRRRFIKRTLLLRKGFNNYLPAEMIQMILSYLKPVWTFCPFYNISMFMHSPNSPYGYALLLMDNSLRYSS